MRWMTCLQQKKSQKQEWMIKRCCMKCDSKITYQISVDTKSDAYALAKAQVETGRATGSHAWKLVRVSDWHIDNCFNDINNTLHRVPGVIHKETRNLYGADAYTSMFMSHENITINLFKELAKGSTEPLLFIEYIPEEASKKNPVPLYLSEIIDNYNAKQVKR